MDLLFIHHSVGGQWLADSGPPAARAASTRPTQTGGGLRAALEHAGYNVHEASYDNRLGSDTDLFDWLPKFRDGMDDLLACDHQDHRLPAGRENRVVIFKSCFPNNNFVGMGSGGGDPAGPALTVANAWHPTPHCSIISGVAWTCCSSA